MPVFSSRAPWPWSSLLWHLLLAGSFVAAMSACAAPLPEWDRRAGQGEGPAPLDAGDAPTLRFDPPAAPDAVTRVTRVTVWLGRPAVSPRVVLVEGALTAAQLREIGRPTLPQTIAARSVPALVWASQQGEVVIAPLVTLSAATSYAIGVSDPPFALPFTVAATDVAPVLSRIWPEPSAGPASRAAVWCAPADLPAVDREIALAPAKSRGRLARGTGTTLSAPSCLGWFAAEPRREAPPTIVTPVVTPPWVEFEGGAMALLEPAQLWPDLAVPAPPVLICEANETAFGPGCAAVLDDRVVVRGPDRAMLWTLASGEASKVQKSRGAQSFVVRPLPADGRLRWAVLDESGHQAEGEVPVSPAPPMDHLVINEVLANPAGAERDQEWIEIYNDGSRPVSLLGKVLGTGGGDIALPAGELASGAFALLVSERYAENDGVDRPPAPGTVLLRVPALGPGGLSNDGERLWLRDADGRVLSTFPAMKAKSGVSNVRVAPDAPDANADSFAASPNGSATPGAPNAAP